jgi:hypothetical protein
VFENKVLRRIFGLKRVVLIKSRRMRWAWHVALMGTKRKT